LLTADSCCDIALPRLPQRSVLEGTGHLPPRVSALEDEIETEYAAEVNSRAGERGEKVDAFSVAPPPAASRTAAGIASTLLASAVGNGINLLPRDVGGSIPEAAGVGSASAGFGLGAAGPEAAPGAGAAVVEAARRPSHKEEGPLRGRSRGRGRSRSSSFDPASRQRGRASQPTDRSQRPASTRSPRGDTRRGGERGAGAGRDSQRHSHSRSRSGGRAREGARGDDHSRRDGGGACVDRTADRFPQPRRSRSRSRSREGRYRREGGSARGRDAGSHATFGREKQGDRGRGSGRSPSPPANTRDRGRYERYSAERRRGRSTSRRRDRSSRMEASRYSYGRRESSDRPGASGRGRSSSHSRSPLPSERRAGSVRAGGRDGAAPGGARAPLPHPVALVAPARTSAATPAEGSVEYWNDMRAKLGLKPLK
jgi:hypothetical protein